MLRRGGLIVTVPTGSWPTMAEEAAARGVRATGYSVAPDARTLAVITRLIDDGAMRVHVDREFPLAEGSAAHELLADGHVRGKLVLRVAPDPAYARRHGCPCPCPCECPFVGWPGGPADAAACDGRTPRHPLGSARPRLEQRLPSSLRR